MRNSFGFSIRDSERRSRSDRGCSVTTGLAAGNNPDVAGASSEYRNPNSDASRYFRTCVWYCSWSNTYGNTLVREVHSSQESPSHRKAAEFKGEALEQRPRRERSSRGIVRLRAPIDLSYLSHRRYRMSSNKFDKSTKAKINREKTGGRTKARVTRDEIHGRPSLISLFCDYFSLTKAYLVDRWFVLHRFLGQK